MPGTPSWLTLDEAAAQLSLNRETVRLLAVRGDLPGAKKFGNRWRIPATALEPEVQVEKSLIAPLNNRSRALQGCRRAGLRGTQ